METGHRANDGVLPTLLRESAFRDRLVGFLVKWILDARLPILSFHDEFVFVLQELGELSEQVRGQRCEAHLLSAVDGKALLGPNDDVVMSDPGDRYLLDGYKMLERVEELLLRIMFFFDDGLLFLSRCK